MTGSATISRRQVLNIAAGAGGASITSTAAMIGTSAAQAARMSQKAAKYQQTPKGEQRCENCALFEPPSSCKVVDGTVVSYGWCIRYTKR
jgi:hypothetical protein